jgi:hypothetical protein
MATSRIVGSGYWSEQVWRGSASRQHADFCLDELGRRCLSIHLQGDAGEVRSIRRPSVWPCTCRSKALATCRANFCGEVSMGRARGWHTQIDPYSDFN